MKRVLAIIDGTPLWMWPLLLLLLCLGWQAGQPRTVKLAQLFILPAAIFVTSVVSLYAAAPTVFSVRNCGWLRDWFCRAPGKWVPVFGMQFRPSELLQNTKGGYDISNAIPIK